MTSIANSLENSDRLFETAVGPIRVRDRTFYPTAAFATYWRFAAARQAIYLSRLRGDPWPWTDDEILRSFRFTNCFRASDRVSQFLISSVQHESGCRDEADLVFRTLFFKIFNREDTWTQVQSEVGPIHWSTYDFEAYKRALDSAAAGGPIYSAAYMMPAPPLGEERKRANHLRLLELMMGNGMVRSVVTSPDLACVFSHLLSYPSIGPFLAFQYATDLNYSNILAFDEDDFVVAGPGAKDGIRKCFGPGTAGLEADIIRYMVDTQECHFGRLGLTFPGLFGRRLHLVDAQNLFCEVDKYARVRYPGIPGVSGRSRVKQRFHPAHTVPTPLLPESWRLARGGAVRPTAQRLDE